MDQDPKIQIPNGYFNGFEMSLTGADVMMVLKLNNNAIVQLNTSFTVAKTLAKKLSKIMEAFESSSNQRIMDTEEVITALDLLSKKRELNENEDEDEESG